MDQDELLYKKKYLKYKAKYEMLSAGAGGHVGVGGHACYCRGSEGFVNVPVWFESGVAAV